MRILSTLRSLFRFRLLLVGVALLASVASCASPGSGGKELSVGLSVPTLTNPYFAGIDHGVRERTTQLGYHVIERDANNDMATQIAQIAELITQKVDVVVVPIDSDGIAPAVKQANAAKIPIIALDRDVNAGQAIFIGSNNVELGAQAADWIAARLKSRSGEASGNVVDLQGLHRITAARDRERGFTEELKKFPGIRIVASQAGDFDQEKSRIATSAILRVNSSVDAIFCANDDNALGAIKAIQDAKKLEPAGATGHVFVIGIDGIPEALKGIRNNTLDATLTQNPVKWAVKAIDFAQEISEGKQPEQHVDYPFMLLDKSNIDSPEAKSYGLWGDVVSHG